VKPNALSAALPKMAAFTLCASISVTVFASDALKVGSALPSASAQSIKQPAAQSVNQTMTAPKSPAFPVQPTTPMKPPAAPPVAPPIRDAAKATLVAPGVLGNAITGLGDGSRGIVAGESLTIRGRGFGAGAGRVEIFVQTPSNSNAQLPFRVSQWSDTELHGSVGASMGLNDGKAAITIFPAGRSVSEAINSSQSGVGGATHQGWRFRFTASRAEQTLAMNGLGSALTSSYPNPTPQLIPQGTGLVKGLAVARRYQAAPLGCNEAPPTDRYKVALASGFELVRVAATDLNANKRHGLAKPEACDVRSSVPSANFLRVGADGSFVISPGWDTINRYGSRSKIDGCDSSRFIGVTKTPLGFDWDNTGTDRCAANSEYVIDHLVARGPAGVNALTGVPTNGATIK
jgi:hypothetical protein